MSLNATLLLFDPKLLANCRAHISLQLVPDLLAIFFIRAILKKKQATLKREITISRASEVAPPVRPFKNSLNNEV